MGSTNQNMRRFSTSASTRLFPTFGGFGEFLWDRAGIPSRDLKMIGCTNMISSKPTS